jgi:hypothetical protein
MAIQEQLFALGKAYPIVTLVIAALLFLMGLKAAKLLKRIFFALAIIVLIISIIMVFA